MKNKTSGKNCYATTSLKNGSPTTNAMKKNAIPKNGMNMRMNCANRPICWKNRSVTARKSVHKRALR